MAAPVNINLLREQQAAFDRVQAQYLREARALGKRATRRTVAPRDTAPVLTPKERERTFDQWSQQRDRTLYKPYSWMTCGPY